MDPADSQALTVEVAFCPGPELCDRVTLTLPAGSTAADAIAASGLRERHGLPLAGLRLGVWSKLREPDSPLRSGDRVEIYRPLKVDPKEARRQRYQQHKESQARRVAEKAAKAEQSAKAGTTGSAAAAPGADPLVS